MSKSIFMGEGQNAELTPEQKESVKKFSESQIAQDKEMLEKNRLAEQAKKTATLAELLQTKINPTEDRVVVWPDPVSEFTESGLLMKPQEVQEKEKPLTGTVIAVGPGKNYEEQVTHILLLNLLQHASDIPADELEKLKKEVSKGAVVYNTGDRVLYGRFAGTPVPDPTTGVEVLLMRAGDIFAKV